MPAFLHGITVTEASAARGLAIVATGVIGLVATAPAPIDPALFPLNAPVVIGQPGGAVTLADAIAKAGAGGTLKAALETIAAQVRAPVVVVRVAPGADTAATNASVIGAEANGIRTGLQALLAAEVRTGFKPRIIGAPGLDTQPVAVALAAVAAKLRARAYAAAIGATRADVITYRGGFTQRELMLVWPDFAIPGGTTTAVAAALGLRAQIDQESGWHKTLSNVPVSGVIGTTRDVQFDLSDPDSDVQLLNAAGITTIVRLDGDLRFWGNRTCAEENSDFVFESSVATAQVLADTMVKGLLWAIDRPLVPSLARDIVEQINAAFRKLTREGRLLGARAFFDADSNPADQLAAGKLTIGYRYTPVPPLEHLALVQEISDEFLADFATLVANG